MEDRRLEIVEHSTGDKTIEGRYHRFNNLLGKGAYKTVYKAFDTIDQVDVAWNSIDLSALTDNEKEKVFSECEMLQKLNHPNILKIRDKWRNNAREELCFVTDIIQNGSIRSYFKKRKINLKSIKQICYQILLALNYLHSNNVIHRDLKCDNIFIDSNNSKVVLGDLGLSVNFNGQSRMSIVGTPHWMAPELYNEKYNELVDIWSFGMCVLELTTNTIPYKECKNTIAVYNKVMIEKQKPDILFTLNDRYIKSFIKICLEFNYKLRPTANELLSHPFLWPRYPHDYILCEQLMTSRSAYGMNGMASNNRLQKPMNIKKQKVMIDPLKKHKKRKKRSHKYKKNTNDVCVDKVVSKRNFITTIKLQIYRKNDKPMAVTFDFNINIDKASDVAIEMINELKLPTIYKLKVENAINKAIQSENSHKTQIIGQSLTGIAVPVAVAPIATQTEKKAVAVAVAVTVTQTKAVAPTKPSTPKKPIRQTQVIIKAEEKKADEKRDMDELEGELQLQIENNLILGDLASYLNTENDCEIASEMDEKAQEQIAKKREELLKEYNDFIITKQELLKLRIEAITENEQRENEIRNMRIKIEKKKVEMEKQYENFINDYKDIAQYTLTSKKVNIAQSFMFEKDQKFIQLMQSKLSKDEKYKFNHKLKDYRQQIVDKYLVYYSNLIKQYSQ